MNIELLVALCLARIVILCVGAEIDNIRVHQRICSGSGLQAVPFAQAGQMLAHVDMWQLNAPVKVPKAPRQVEAWVTHLRNLPSLEVRTVGFADVELRNSHKNIAVTVYHIMHLTEDGHVVKIVDCQLVTHSDTGGHPHCVIGTNEGGIRTFIPSNTVDGCT